MTIAREAIFAKIEELFGDITDIGEVERMPSGDPSKFPALHIFDGGQNPSAEEAGTSRYDLSIEIVGYVQGSGGAAAHTALNALYGEVVAALVTEPPVGGLVTEIEEESFHASPAALASVTRLAFTLNFQVHFPTARGSADLVQ